MLISFIYVYSYIYLCVHTWMNMYHDFWLSEDNLQELVLSFYCLSLGDPILVTKPGGRPYPVSHLSGLTLACLTSGKLDAIIILPQVRNPHSNFIQKLSLFLLSLWLGNWRTSYRFAADAVVFSFTFTLLGVIRLGCEFGEIFHHCLFKNFLSILPSLPSFCVPITCTCHHVQWHHRSSLFSPMFLHQRFSLCFWGYHVSVEVIPSAEILQLSTNEPIKGILRFCEVDFDHHCFFL